MRPSQNTEDSTRVRCAQGYETLRGRLTSGAGQPDRARSQLAMVEPGRLGQYLQQRRQIDLKSPFVGATARARCAARGVVPPGRDAACDGLQYQDTDTAPRSGE